MESLVSYNPLALLNASSTSFQSQIFWELTFLVQDTQAGEPNMELGSFFPWGESLHLWLFSHLWSPYQVCGVNCTESLPFLSCLIVVPFYIFSCRRSFLLLFRSFSSIIALWIVVILVCPWPEVSSKSSYSTVLAKVLQIDFICICLCPLLRNCHLHN